MSCYWCYFSSCWDQQPDKRPDAKQAQQAIREAQQTAKLAAQQQKVVPFLIWWLLCYWHLNADAQCWWSHLMFQLMMVRTLYLFLLAGGFWFDIQGGLVDNFIRCISSNNKTTSRTVGKGMNNGSFWRFCSNHQHQLLPLHLLHMVNPHQ